MINTKRYIKLIRKLSIKRYFIIRYTIIIVLLILKVY